MNNKEEVLKNYKKIAKKYLDDLKDCWYETNVHINYFESVDVLPKKVYKKAKENPWNIQIWINVKNGNIVYEKPKTGKFLETTKINYSEIDEKYDAIKIVEISFWPNGCIDKFNKMDTNPGIYLSYIFKDKTIICTKTNRWRLAQSLEDLNPEIIDPKNISAYDIRHHYAMFGISHTGCVNYAVKEFSKFFGIGFISGNTYTNFNDGIETINFLRAKDVLYKDTPKQKRVDELIKINLPAISINKANKNNSKLTCVANRVNDEYAVLRYFIPKFNKTLYEVSRLYVSKKDYIFARKNQEEKFCVCNQKLNAEHFNSDNMVLDSEDIFDGTMLEYFKDIYKELKIEEKGKALYLLTTQPTFEKLYKMGFNKICKDYLEISNGDVSWKKYLENYFGPIDNIKEKNINKMLGFNKYQMEKLKKYQRIYNYRDSWSYENGWERLNCGFGAVLKVLFKDVNSFNDIDNTSFDKIFDVFDTILHYEDYSYTYTLRELYKALNAVLNVYSTKTCLNVLPNIKDLIIIHSNIHHGHNHISFDYSYLRTFTDYVNLIQQLDRINEIKPYFNTKEDLVRMHDDAAITYNLQKDKFETEKFKKRSGCWKKWEYSEDDKFIAIAPTLPADLAVEGITLHHCVKSYIGRVTNGLTNIMFIRKKDDTEKPFFTVEVSNKGDIEQVHGFANRNASTEPGLIDFVEKWAKERKLKLHGINKVR